MTVKSAVAYLQDGYEFTTDEGVKVLPLVQAIRQLIQERRRSGERCEIIHRARELNPAAHDLTHERLAHARNEAWMENPWIPIGPKNDPGDGSKVYQTGTQNTEKTYPLGIVASVAIQKVAGKGV